MAIWYTPKSNWAVGEVVPSSKMNEIGSDLEYLFFRPSFVGSNTSDATTTSASLVDVDGTNLSGSIDTEGGDVLIAFSGETLMSNSSGRIDIAWDGTPLGNAEPYLAWSPTTRINFGIVRLLQQPSAGTHTFAAKFLSANGTSTMTIYSKAMLVVKEI